MSILARELAHLCEALENSGGLTAELRVRLLRAHDLAAGLDPYLERCTTPESPARAELARRTRDVAWQPPLEREMLSGRVEGQTLKMLVSLSRATNVLDIGMFTGYSALAMAEGLAGEGSVVACEVDPTVAALARDCFDASPVGHRITVEIGPALDTLRALAQQSAVFDFVFIDADKTGYLNYLEFLLDSTLLAPNAVVAVDNTLLQGEPYGAGGTLSRNGAAVAMFNAALTYDSRVEQVILPLRDGLTLIRRTGAPPS